ncbi:S8 family peptidase [Mediterraneibacter glycyrrhizinilyticus]|uniref:S8 family peptidase n=1 Tax=Mediterraneibacter glycyrrhizinilyticus TaxID=342942 RepID=UPI001960316C|nr:S8 family peptidase [Mediterraneibacter glycyrrhizinilyticus]MBM6750998.1 S8 family peptidase [Mediterraneibacter glycyrrhizinilyticus]
MSEKIEDLLNLALEATEEERERSQELEVGFDPLEKEWELIVKYSGDPEQIREIAVNVTLLMNGYAVVLVREDRINDLAGLDGVEFIEKPKNLYFQVENGRNASCINPVQNPPFSLSGRGVLTGIVDSGIDLAHPDFRNEDGTTRVLALWDQTIPGNPPSGYSRGSEYTAEEINRILMPQPMEPGGGTESGEPERAGGVGQGQAAQDRILPGRDISGHGTAVAGIAAGNGRGSEGRRFRGVAPESSLIVVKMGQAREGGFPRTTELMEGVDYIIRKAQEMRMPVAVNISFGNTYGSHDGTSLLERYLDAAADTWKNVISVGSGNEGNTAGHVSGKMREGEETEIQLAVQAREPGLNVQIWKSYVDEAAVSIISPSGETAGPLRETAGARRFLVGQTELLVYYGEPKPYSVRQEIYISFLPMGSYVDSGVWRIRLTPGRIVDGSYQMWLPAQSALNVGTAFLEPDSSSTATIPSTAGRVITVGAYDALTFAYADFSGRGADGRYEGSGVPKPDLAAPGVRVQAPAAAGGYGAFTGTSFAAPFVTGSAALLMEWGIVQGNDPYLYGEKVKAYLRRGARQLPGYESFPNPQIGYGILCLRDSLPS